MALQISFKKGVFYLKGKITSSTIKSFVIHFEHYILKNKKTIININKIKEIDSDGLIAIKKLMQMATRNQRKFYTVSSSNNFHIA